ncbi:MAG TPA: right-handed parallel beta-helix repeat-containing protein, partial [Xanthomonadales bacterium]|nr:right-handed parallel beta-helix repeat-containing protein [Xanthomonadales bacterium]
MTQSPRLTFLLLSALIAANAQGQTISLQGTNLGAIPDGAGTGPNNYGAPRDVRFLVNSPGTAQDVRFQIQAAHTYVGDLKVTLISPQGIEHLAFERTGATTASAAGSPANLVLIPGQGYTFRDDSANNWWTIAGTTDVNIAASDARTVIAGPTTAPAAVTAINAAFADRPVAGSWILRFEDGWSGDTGEVTGVTLQITPRSATLAVSKVEDTNDGVCNSDCSLREAVAAATPGQQIIFAAPFFDAPRTIFLSSELLVNKNLAISGPGAHRLTISAANRSRVFRVTGSRVTLAGMRISDGVGADAGGVSAQGGDLVLHRIEVSNCRASGVSSFGAGGVYQSSGGSLLLSESSITGNQGLGSSTAGGLAVDGTARILRSTISGNVIVSIFANTSAGISSAFSNLSVIDSTVTGNIVRGSSQAAGIVQGSSGRVTISNSAVAGNVGGNADIVLFNTSTLVSGGYNAIGRVGTLPGNFNQPGDQFGTTITPLDPVLSPLSYHGGTVPAHVPLLGSPLLDKGKSVRAADVRGAPLVNLAVEPAAGGNDADIGAVELSPIFVENLSFNDPGSLRQALLNAPAAPAVTDILFDPALTVTPATLRFGTQISIDRNVSIHGPGAQRLTLNGGRQARVLTVLENRLVSISGLTLADGNANSRDNTPPNPGAGGVVLNGAGSHLSIIDSVVSGGRTNAGSAIQNRGALLLRGSSITGNAGSVDNSVVLSGFANSTTLIELSTISGNRGNALGLEQASASVLRSTIHANAGANAVDALISPTFVFGSIIAGQRSGNDFSNNSNGRVISGGYNFIGNPGTVAAFNQTGDQVGTSGSPLDPRLSPLAIYSGQVPVHMPLANSTSVIDRGQGRIRDQRGLTLFDVPFFNAASGGDHSDIGATEAQVQIVDTPGDAGPGTLRQALLNANANGPGVDDVLLVGFGRIDLTGALPTLTGSTNLVGPGATGITITRAAGAADFGLISAVGPAQPSVPIHLGISGVTLSNGRDSGANGGGAVDANQAELHLTEVEVTGSVGTAESAGGVSLFFGDGLIQNSTFANNAGTVGGALHFEGRNHRLRVEQSTFSGNTAENGAAIHVVANADNGPAAQARLEVLSSTLADNTASSFAGAILAVGRNGNPDATAPVTMKNTLLSNNGNSTNAILIAPLLTSQGFNLSNVALPQLTFTGDASPANTALDPLANNGGPVRTRAPRGGSSALDGGFSTNALFDARGFARQLDLPTITNFEFGDASDIGAVEAQTAPISPPAAPTVAYNPSVGGSVTFAFFDVSTNRGFVSVNSSGGVAPGTVRVSACAATTGFTIINGPIDLLGTAGGMQISGSLIDLRCTPSASVQNGTLTCTETANPGSAVQRSWNLSCPAADNVPPALTFNPTAGSTINYATTGTAAPIAVTPSGGFGSGQPATTTLSECSITNGGAAFPTTTVAQLSFVGASTTAQNLNLPNCVRQSTAVNATVSC